jgi:Xaa-Pro aminopeptidase
MTTVRIERLRAEFDGLGAASFLVSDLVNVRYLTGFESSNAFVLVKHKQVLLFTDGRYIEAARGVDGVEVVQLERDLAADLGPRLRDLAEPPVAFEADTLSFAAYQALARGGVDLVPATGVVKRLRAVKEEAELDAIRRAARILNETFERLARERLVGRTEADVAWRIREVLHEEGADDVSFDPIVGSGPNGALPHHHPGDRRIERDELVVVDAGAKLDGYYSDCTRTFVTGELSEELRQAYAVCRSVQEAALAEVKAGADSRGLDALARREIEESGIARLVHGLGHGVGLELQELPVLRPTADGVLAAGNVVTVEPGVYLPGLGGVRIEDLVIVHEDGAEVLTPFTKDPLTLD